MQPNGMPQFGGQRNNRSQVTQSAQPVFGGQEAVFSANPNHVETATTIEKKKKDNPFTSLKKDQVLPALVAIFGFLALIFLVSTIALAVAKPKSEDTISEKTTIINESATAEVLRFIPDKIVDGDGIKYKYGPIIKNNDGHLVVATNINGVGMGATLEVNWEFAANYYQVSSTRVDQELFRIPTNVLIADLMIGRASNDQLDDVLLIMLTNGKIAYMPLRESLEKYSFKSYGEIDDVSDAVKFYRAYEDVNGEFIETVLVQKSSGEIVDLRQQLLKIVGKDIK